MSGLDRRWSSLKTTAYGEVQKPWGGMTVNAQTGRPLASDADRYALSVKPAGLHTVSVPEGASEREFAAAMDRALADFRGELEKGQRYLGIFHDDDHKRIDIDPVVVVDSPGEVERIGAYTRAIGGAYHFASGDGYFPPHVGETVAARMTGLPPLGESVHWAGPGQWRSAAEAAQEPFDDAEDDGAAQRYDPRERRLPKGVPGGGRWGSGGSASFGTLGPGSVLPGRPPGVTTYDLPAGQGGTAAPSTAAAVKAAGFIGPLASKVQLGGDQSAWPELAGALNTIPAPLQQRMTKAIGRIQLESQIPVSEAIAREIGPGTLVGQYTPGRHGWADDEGRGEGNGLLQLATLHGEQGTVRHEAMHALDEADGYPSDKLRWRLLARKVRKAGGRQSAPEFQSDGTGNDARRSAEELWAELASQILGGETQLNLDPARGGKVYHAGPPPILPDDLAREVRDYFAQQGVTPPQGGS